MVWDIFSQAMHGLRRNYNAKYLPKEREQTDQEWLQSRIDRSKKYTYEPERGVKKV
jgi:hypothetical protein